jgi:DNA-binding GntR family transcriptional regulator
MTRRLQTECAVSEPIDTDSVSRRPYPPLPEALGRKGHKPNLPSTSPDSLSDKAYFGILEAIRHGRLLPGTRLRETDLAAWLSISRTPVREAIHRLKGEGLLSAAAGKSLVVTQVDRGLVDDLYVLREVLEGTAAGLAAARATSADLQILEELIEAEGSIQVTDVERLVDANRRFHDFTSGVAKNRFLQRALSVLSDSLALLGASTLDNPARAAVARHQHREIVYAIKDRDTERAERLMRAHIQDAHRARVSRLLK